MAYEKFRLKARAAKGPKKETFVRVGGQADKVYLDLGDESWEVIEIDGEGWRVIREAPVPMLRYAGMESLPRPVRGGRIEELQEYVNAPDDDAFKLVVSFCVTSLFPHGPYVVLEFAGPSGSLKSSATRALKRLIDPNKVDLRSKPRTEDDLFIAAERIHVSAFENLSSISEELSDWLCRLSTGAGRSKRALYTNRDETLFDACKPVVFNGIPDLIDRDDLAERAIMMVLKTFKGTRRTEEDVKHEFDTIARPRILGCLLDGVARALAEQANIAFPQDGPRMADFARRAIAAFPAFGWPEEDFMRVWRNYRANVAEKSVEADSIAEAVRRFMEDKSTWQGDATNLLKLLNEHCPTVAARMDKSWPKMSNHLTNRLRRAMPMLATTGITIDLEGKDRNTRRRTIIITKVDEHEMASA